MTLTTFVCRRDDCKCKCSGGKDKFLGKIPPEKGSDGEEIKDSNQKGSAKPNEQLKDKGSTGKDNEKPTKTGTGSDLLF